MTIEAHAFSQGTDITSSVGPFIFSANSPSVVSLFPIVNTAYNFPTNQATAKALTPGMTQIYATAGGVSSSSFQQPQYQNSVGDTSPALDFFETCPIQSIELEVGAAGSQQTTQTTFVTSKGTSQNVTAVLTDIMGNTSLPNTYGGIVLSKILLTWTASQPGVLATGTGCLQSCALSTPLPGSGSVTASCSPPTCNIGYPLVPASLSSPAAVASCTNFFHAQFPQLINCQQLIPAPVYADTAVSGIITGATTPAAVLAAATGCAHVAPANCTSSVYSLSTARAATGAENPLPVPPNSLLYDLAGDKIFMGSDFGAQIVSPGNFGTSNNPYTALGTVTGNALASSNNGTVAVYSDTIHIPNQAYVVNTANVNSLTSTALNISSAGLAAFSPDGLKTFIVGGNTGTSLYVYSSLLALQGPNSNPQLALAGPAKAVAFSPNGAFAFVAESSTSTTSANLTAFTTCYNPIAASSNQIAATLSLPANPILMKVLPGVHIDGTDSFGNLIPDGVHVFVLDATGFDVITSTISPPVAGTLCPQVLQFSPLQRVELNQGTLQPVNFFTSADGSQLYIAAASTASILVYDFNTGTLTGIELQGNATPLSADISPDAGTIVIAGSDGMLHQVSTAFGGNDVVQLAFPNLPNYLNPFCTFTPTTGPCSLNTVLVKP
jgi:WD40 repeat protein